MGQLSINMQEIANMHKQLAKRLDVNLARIDSATDEFKKANKKLTQQLNRTQTILNDGKVIMSAIESFEKGGNISRLLQIQDQHR